MSKLFLANKKIVLVWAFAALGLYYASDTFATCVKVLRANGSLAGCAVLEVYPPTIKTCSCSTATISVNTNLSHHEVLLRVGDQEPLDFTLGEEKATGFWDIRPGQAYGDNIVATFTMTDEACSGSDAITAGSLGSGQCDYSVRYEIPVVTPSDFNGENGENGENGANIINQTCSTSPNSTEERPKSLLTYTAFCQEAIPTSGRGVGRVKWREGQGPPAQFTNCTEFLLDENGDFLLDENEIPNNVCILQVGFFPTTFEPYTSSFVVDPIACAEIFPAVTDPNMPLAEKQVLFLQQEWLGTCPEEGGTEPPTDDQSVAEGDSGAGSDDDPQTIPPGIPITLNQFPRVVQVISRECNAGYGGGEISDPGSANAFTWPSGGGPQDARRQFGEGFFGDGFDNGSRVCPPHVTVAGVEEPTSVGTAVITNLNEAMTTAPPSQVVNLGCKKGGSRDKGKVWVEICGTPDLDVMDIKLDPGPALEDGQRPRQSEVVIATSGPCAFDAAGIPNLRQSLRLQYFTCLADGTTGLAQVIWGKARAGECTNDPVQDHDTCPVGLQAERETQTAPGVPVILQDVMEVEVNKVKAIPPL